MNFGNIAGFQWDDGNDAKNWHKHRVTWQECEEVFFNQPLIIKEDDKHSQHELRYHAFGKTNVVRLLFVVFTVRDGKIRIISARIMNKKEKYYYEKT